MRRLWLVMVVLFALHGAVMAQDTETPVPTDTPYPTATYTPSITPTPTPDLFAVITLQAPSGESQAAAVEYRISVGDIGIMIPVWLLVLLKLAEFIVHRTEQGRG
jgi:hypothetical protein